MRPGFNQLFRLSLQFPEVVNDLVGKFARWFHVECLNGVIYLLDPDLNENSSLSCQVSGEHPVSSQLALQLTSSLDFSCSSNSSVKPIGDFRPPL